MNPKKPVKAWTTLACGVLLAATLTMTACNQTNAQEMVMKVNDTVVTKGELDKKTSQIMSMMNFGSTDGSPQAKQLETVFNHMAAQSLLFDTLAEQEAQKRHLVVNNEELDKAFEKESLKLGNIDAFRNYLSQMKLTEADFKEALRAELLKDKLVAELAGDRVKVTDQQAATFYSKNPKLFEVPEQVHARHILVSFDAFSAQETFKKEHPKASDAELAKVLQAEAAKKEAEAKAILEQVKKNPEQFQALAKSKSDDKASAVEGGDLGFFSKEQMVPTFAQAAFNTPVNSICPNVVKSRFGYHVIQVVEKKPAQKQPYEKVKAQIEDQLSHQAKVKELQTWFETAKTKATVEYGQNYKDILTPPAAPQMTPEGGKPQAPAKPAPGKQAS